MLKEKMIPQRLSKIRESFWDYPKSQFKELKWRKVGVNF